MLSSPLFTARSYGSRDTAAGVWREDSDTKIPGTCTSACLRFFGRRARPNRPCWSIKGASAIAWQRCYQVVSTVLGFFAPVEGKRGRRRQLCRVATIQLVSQPSFRMSQTHDSIVGCSYVEDSVVFALLLCGGGSPAATGPGARAFAERCATCHGLDAAGSEQAPSGC